MSDKDNFNCSNFKKTKTPKNVCSNEQNTNEYYNFNCNNINNTNTNTNNTNLNTNIYDDKFASLDELINDHIEYGNENIQYDLRNNRIEELNTNPNAIYNSQSMIQNQIDLKNSKRSEKITNFRENKSTN